MLVRCNIGCRKSDGQTDASLDIESDIALCNTCGDKLGNISEYTKLSMKANGDIVRSINRKAFVFPCLSCDKSVEAEVKAGVLVGKLCPNDQSGCLLNTTEHMVHAIKATKEKYE
jgi:hypothetical protein